MKNLLMSAALLAIVLVPAGAAAAPCRNAKGQFAKCGTPGSMTLDQYHAMKNGHGMMGAPHPGMMPAPAPAHPAMAATPAPAHPPMMAMPAPAPTPAAHHSFFHPATAPKPAVTPAPKPTATPAPKPCTGLRAKLHKCK